MNYIICALLLFVCCNNPGSTDRVFKSSHFKIFYTEFDDARIKEISDSLEINYPRIITNLHSERLSIVNVHFYTDIFSLKKAVQSSVPYLPDWAVGLATSVTEIHMLSPNHPQQDYSTMIRNTIHEFVHCVSLGINSTIANNPRWLWEAVAIFEANQSPNPHHISYLVNQKPPNLEELNQMSNTYIYEVGYLIADFLVTTKGPIVLNTLIRNNGKLKMTLNLDDKEFTKQWFAYVKRKYGI